MAEEVDEEHSHRTEDPNPRHGSNTDEEMDVDENEG